MPLERRIFWPSLGDQVLQPRHEFRRIERFFRAQRQRLHVFIVIVFQAAMAVGMIVVVMIVVVIMMMVMIVAVAGVQKFRLDLEDAIEIERAALQHVGQLRPGSARCDAALRKG